MKTIVLAFILFLLGILQGIAQASVTGKLTDSNSRVVEAATLSLLKKEDSQFVKAAISDARGIFNIKDINPGAYTLLINSLGFVERRIPITLKDGQVYDLQTLVLEEESEELEGVTVTGEKPIVQVLADKTVFNVQSTISATGSSGFELLRMAPGVLIDNNDNLIVEGKNGVLIYIDDKPSVLRGADLVNYLKSIQASDVDNIEIITQPSSKYDAEGNAGIINIKLKRDKSLGVNGTVGAGFAYGDFARYNSSLSFNNRNKKTNLYGTYSNSFGKSFSFINLFRRQNNTIFDARTETISDNNNNNLRMGFDYYANAKSTFGVIVV